MRGQRSKCRANLSLPASPAAALHLLFLPAPKALAHYGPPVPLRGPEQNC